jgi:drug/metabolite transporter (DMT)-like permease
MLARYGALATLILIWGTTWAVIRVGLEGIPPFTGVTLRFGIAALVLYLAARLARVDLHDGGSRLRRLWVINTIFSFAVPYCVVYWAEQWVPSGLAALLFATYPLFVTILAHFRLPAERMRALTVVGILIGFVGVAMVYSEDLSELAGDRVRFAAAVYLLAPAAGAVSTVEVKRRGAGLPALALTAPPMAFTAVLVAPLAVVSERNPLQLDAVALGALVYLSLIGSAVAFGLYFWLLARLPATRLAMITYATPIVALAVGVLALGERLTLRICIGAVLVLGGVAVALRFARPMNGPSRPASCRDTS